MSDKIYLSASIYFKVLDSVFYGGKGSVGFVEAAFGEIHNSEGLTDDLAERQREIVAKTLRVSVENVQFITREEYQMATEEDGDFDDFDNYDLIPFS